MEKLNENETKYDSIMEFAVLGKDDEMINPSTLIATTKKKKKQLTKQRNNGKANCNISCIL